MVIIGAVIGAIIAVLIEIADILNWGGVFLRIVRTVYEGGIGTLGGFGIGLLIGFIVVILPLIPIDPGAANNIIEGIVKGLAAALTSGIISGILAAIGIVFIAIIAALVGTLIGLIAGAMLEFTSP